MRILITGGTGFVGSHCVRALLDAGHEVTLLVRERARVSRALAPLGVGEQRCEVITGDVLDAHVIELALENVDAVLHAANVYSLKAGDAELMRQVNVEGTRRVLTAAAKRGLDPIVHVSSTVALLPSDHLTSSSPVGQPHGGYLISKAAAETIARDLQEAGAPIVITNPSAVLGPHDPHLGDTATGFRNVLKGRSPMIFTGGCGYVDVRDLAAAHAKLFTPGRGPRRYLMGGTWVSMAELYRLVGEVVGRRVMRVRFPVSIALAAGRLADTLQRRGIDPGFSSALLWIFANHPPLDDTSTREELDITWRPIGESLRDTIAWLHNEDHLTRRQAGTAAGASWTIAPPSPTGHG